MSTFFRFRFWDYRWYQKAADEIQNDWNLPPDLADFFAKLSDALPEKLQKALIDYLKKLYKTEGKAVVEAILKKLMEVLKIA